MVGAYLKGIASNTRAPRGSRHYRRIVKRLPFTAKRIQAQDGNAGKFPPGVPALEKRPPAQQSGLKTGCVALELVGAGIVFLNKAYLPLLNRPFFSRQSLQ